MNYPLISEYIESIKAAEENFDQLKHLRPVLDSAGEPVMSSGNFAVVFKMKDEQTGKLHALKCFLKDQEGRAEAYRMIAEELEFVNSTFLTSIKYLDEELFVDTNNSDKTEFPVLLMDWVDGLTLDKFIREHIDDEYELALLAYQFSRLAMWLMPQPFAHGDLKPDNILVKDDGTLVLVDYDGMYVPAMKGQKARELGSPDFRHPSRTEEVFDEHIDDFSLASILLSLKAIALQPSLLEEYGASDRLLFSEKDYRNLSESSSLGALQQFMQDAELASLYSLYILALSQNNLSQVSFRLFNLNRPEKSVNLNAINKICSIYWFGKYGYNVDKYGAIYSKDKKILLKLPSSVVVYNVEDGTEIIANKAFDHFSVISGGGAVDISYACLEKLFLPSSVKYVTDEAFGEDGHNLKEIRVSSNPNYYHSLLGVFSDRVITRSPFDIVLTHSKSVYDVNGAEYSMDGTSLLSLFDLSPDVSCYQIKEGVKNANGRGVSGKGLPEIIFSYGIERINGFSGNSLKNIVLPGSLKTIGQSAFERSKEITSIEIPEGVETIGQWAFMSCLKLERVVLPSSLMKIENRAFACNKALKEIIFMGIPTFDRGDFDNCPSLNKIVIPKDSRSYFEKLMTEYTNVLFESSEILSATVIDEDLKNAWTDEVGAKYSADKKRLLKVPKDIKNYSVKEGTVVICNNAFGGIWLMLSRLSKNKNVKSLGVETITIPNTVEKISKKAFYGCSNIKSIFIPIGSKRKFEELLPEYKDKLVEQDEKENLSTEVTDEDLANAWTDEYGVKYSKDKKRLLKAPIYLKEYSIRKGTLVICDFAFTEFGFIKVNDNRKSELSSLLLPIGIKAIGRGAFIWCEELKELIVPNTVEFIGVAAFYNCFRLCNISIPNSLTRIEEEMFVSCQISRLSLPLSINAIGNRAFWNCNLSDITIPNSVTTIEEGAFYGCPLSSVTIPNSITKIEDETFYECFALKRVIIPNSVTEIGNLSFYSCAFAEIELPNSIVRIGNHAFNYCESLKQIDIPDSVEVIEDGAFANCYSLESVRLPKSIKQLGDSLFNECDELKHIIIPIGTKNKYVKLLPEYKDIIEEQDEDKNLSTKVINEDLTNAWVDEYEVWYSKDKKRLLKAPKIISKYIIREGTEVICQYAFKGCSSLIEINIPDSVKVIGQCAFIDCPNLESITIPSGVTKIEEWAFQNTAFIKWYNKQPKGLVYVGKVVYSYKGTMLPNTSIALKDGTSSIGIGAFVHCRGLTSINLPNTITSIEKAAFYGCSNLTSISFPDAVKSIGSCAFEGCSGLSSIHIPNNVTSIGDQAFNNCSNLTTLTISNKLTRIGFRTFGGCSKLVTITIPNSVTSIAPNAFGGCI